MVLAALAASAPGCTADEPGHAGERCNYSALGDGCDDSALCVDGVCHALCRTSADCGGDRCIQFVRPIGAYSACETAGGGTGVRTPPAGNIEPHSGSVVTYPAASRACIDASRACFDGCATDPANCDQSPGSPLCFPNATRVRACRDRCLATRRCFPWERGVTPGPPCRTGNDPYECNFAQCFQAAFACGEDCTNTMASWPGEVFDACVEHCNDLYGCRPRPNDPCNPLPQGYVYCSCPGRHGVNCHAPDYGSCP